MPGELDAVVSVDRHLEVASTPILDLDAHRLGELDDRSFDLDDLLDGQREASAGCGAFGSWWSGQVIRSTVVHAERVYARAPTPHGVALRTWRATG